MIYLFIGPTKVHVLFVTLFIVKFLSMLYFCLETKESQETDLFYFPPGSMQQHMHCNPTRMTFGAAARLLYFYGGRGKIN